MRAYFKTDVLLNFLVILGMVLVFSFQRIPLMITMTVILWAVTLLNYKVMKVTHTRARNILLSSLLFIPAFFKPYFGLSPAFYLFSFIGTIGVGMWLARDSENLFKAIKLLYFTLAVIVGLIIFINQEASNPFVGIIDGASENGIPAYMIVVQVAYSIMHYLMRGKLPLVSCYFTFIVAFYGEGRGSLVVAFAILFTTLAFTIVIRSRTAWGSLQKFVILVSVLYVVITYGPETYLYGILHRKLSVGLFDINRMEILQAYLSKMNAWTVLVGADYSGTLIEYQYFNNPHISMIRTHAMFGLPLLLIFFTSFVWVFWSPLRWTARLVVSTFLFFIILRSATEPLLFPTLLDGLYFSLILTCFNMSSGKVKADNDSHCALLTSKANV